MQQTPWENRFAQRTKNMSGSAIRELLKLTEVPDMISFGGGMPAPEVFPVHEFQEACNTVLFNSGTVALQYGATEGYRPLRELLAKRSGWSGAEISVDNILITSGSQQALDLLGKIFINPGDHILVESPTYMGALQAFNAYNAEYIAVPSDEHGMITSELEKALRTGPKFMYVLPNFQNPTGVTLTIERRREIIELADRYGVPIVEDDPYGQLRFEGEPIPSIITLDQQARGQSGEYNGNVIYLGTFSKILAPGIRLAWVIAPAEIIRKLALAKQGTDLHTSSFNQMVAYEVGKTDFIDNHIKVIQETYRRRRDVMLEVMEEAMPDCIHWTHPEGGLFLWLTCPENCDTTKLLVKAVDEKVAFVPGASFYPCGGGENTMRLNYSNASPEKIQEGMLRLANLLRKAIC